MRTRIVLGCLAAAILLVGCSSESGGSVRGVVVEIDGQLDDIRGFVLLDEDGERHRFRVTAESDFHDLPLSHLNEHRVSGAPVVVEFQELEGELLVVSLADG